MNEWMHFMYRTKFVLKSYLLQKKSPAHQAIQVKNRIS